MGTNKIAPPSDMIEAAKLTVDLLSADDKMDEFYKNYSIWDNGNETTANYEEFASNKRRAINIARLLIEYCESCLKSWEDLK